MMGRVVRTWALDAAAFAEVLAQQDPSWGSGHVPVAGGQLVLCGRGMYVNRALGAGLEAPLTSADFELIETRSAAADVDASIELTPVTHPAVGPQARARGYVVTRTIRALRRPLVARERYPAGGRIVIEPAAHQVAVWQETSALGWGHEAPGARRASDAFAAATATVDGAGFVVARDAATGEPVGCASLAVRESVATLAAMSTVPGARRRGVQAALIVHRLRVARAARCDVATTTVEPGGASERNLVRHGFTSWFDITLLTRPSSPRPD
ncbi:GNAT family N-acetyltransferase [Ilumatobacter sp.]|uniref:GNAT family N-acetyltransferase n=1 Tax=Ilumatobacter sp. TaxID=1967498 RepID=UPI003AF73831